MRIKDQVPSDTFAHLAIMHDRAIDLGYGNIQPDSWIRDNLTPNWTISKNDLALNFQPIWISTKLWAIELKLWACDCVERFIRDHKINVYDYANVLDEVRSFIELSSRSIPINHPDYDVHNTYVVFAKNRTYSKVSNLFKDMLFSISEDKKPTMSFRIHNIAKSFEECIYISINQQVPSSAVRTMHYCNASHDASYLVDLYNRLDRVSPWYVPLYEST